MAKIDVVSETPRELILVVRSVHALTPSLQFRSWTHVFSHSVGSSWSQGIPADRIQSIVRLTTSVKSVADGGTLSLCCRR